MFRAIEFAIDFFEHGQIKLILVAEVVIEHSLIDVGSARDAVHASTTGTTFRKFLDRSGKNSLAGAFRVTFDLGF
ncbi:hypothetical protein THI4931_01850 [Pandoraea sputorum]|nr:hypothetical protein THI4931_01850 [Pandoraea sputorum]